MTKFLKRIGTKSFKFQLEAHIDKVLLKVTSACQLSVHLKRGRHVEETKKVDLDVKTGVATINENLSIISTLYYETNKKKYQDKKLTLTVLIHAANGKTKKAGTVDVNIANYPNQEIKKKTEQLQLQACPIPNSKMVFDLSVLLLSEVDENESVRSGTEMGSDDEFDNMSVMTNEDRNRDDNFEMLNRLNSKTKIDEDINQAAFKKNQGDIENTTPVKAKPAKEPITEEKKVAETFTSSPVKEIKPDPYEFKAVDTSTDESYKAEEKKPVIIQEPKALPKAEPKIEVEVKPEPAPIKEPLFPINDTLKQSKTEEKIKPPTEKIKPPEEKTTTFSRAIGTKAKIGEGAANKSQASIVENDTSVSKDPAKKLVRPIIKADAKPGDMQARLAEIQKNINKKPTATGVDTSKISKASTINNTSNITKDHETSSVIEESFSKTSILSNINNEELNQLKNEIAELKLNQREQQDKIDSMQRDLDFKDKEIVRLGNHYKEKNAEFLKLERNYKEMLQENEGFRIERQSLSNQSDESIELRNKIMEKNNEISKLEKEKDTISEKVTALNLEVYNLGRDKNNEIRTLNTQLDKTKSELKTAQDQVHDLEKKNQALVVKVNGLENDAKNMKFDNANLKKEIESLSAYQQSLLSEKDQVLSTNKSADLEILRYKEKITNLEAEIFRLREQVKTVELERTNLQTITLERSKILENKIKEIEEEKSRTESRALEMDKNNKEFIKNAENQILELKRSIKEAESKKEEALSKQTQISLEFQALRVKFESTSSELTYQQSLQEQKMTEILKLRDDIENEKNSARQKIQALEEKSKKKESDLSTHIIELKDKVSELEMANEELQDKLDASVSKMKQAQHELSIVNSKGDSEFIKIKDEYESQLDLIQKNIKLRDNKINELIEENRLLLEDKQELNQKIEFLSKKLTKDSPDNQTEKLRASELAIQSQVNSLNQEVAKLKGELALAKQNSSGSSELEEQIAQLSIDNESLRKKIQDLEKQVKDSKKVALQQAAKESDDLRAELKEYQRKIRKLEEEIKTNNENFEKVVTDNEELIKASKLDKDKQKKIEETLKIMEEELVRTKQRMGEVMNVVMENGGDEFLDKVYEAMGMIGAKD